MVLRAKAIAAILSESRVGTSSSLRSTAAVAMAPGSSRLRSHRAAYFAVMGRASGVVGS